MTRTPLPPGSIPGLSRSPDRGPRSRSVGPGWEVLLMPEPLARAVTRALARTTVAAPALGWIYADAGQRGIFLPERSDDPAWPPGTTYLKAGANVTLPPYHWRLAERDGVCGWVSLDGHPFSRPLLLHPIVTLLAADMSCSASPAPES